MYQNQNEYAFNLRPRNPGGFQKPVAVPNRCANAPFIRRPMYQVRKRIMGDRMPGHVFRSMPRQPHFRPKFLPVDHRPTQNPNIRPFPPRYNLIEYKLADTPQFPPPIRPPLLNDNAVYQHPVPIRPPQGSFHRCDLVLPNDNSNLKVPETNQVNELWIETQAPDGKFYYYNATTRATVWSKPDNVKVLTQEQIRELTTAIGVPNSNSAPIDQQPPSEPSNAPDILDPPPNLFMGQQNVVMDIGSINPSNFLMFPPPALGVPPAGLMIHGFPPLNPFPIGYTSVIPPFFTNIPASTQYQPPIGEVTVSNSYGAEISNSNGVNVNNSAEMDKEHFLRNDEPINNIISEMKPENTEERSRHHTPDGQVYHENVKVVSSWQPSFHSGSFSETVNHENVSHDSVLDESLHVHDPSCSEIKDSTFPETQQMDVGSENETKIENNSMKTSDSEVQALKKIEAEKKQTKVDKSRPVSSTPVPDTSWCIVWTGDNRVFYYNPNLKSSVWARPVELLGRDDVDKLIRFQPLVPDTKTCSEPEIKKLKMNDESKSVCEDTENKSVTNDHSGLSQKEQIIEAEAKASKERATIPLELRMETFRLLLAEKNVSAFSTWEKELHKIVFDDRYLLLSSKERRQVFECYIKEKAESEKNERKKKIRQQRDEYIRLLKEVVTSPEMRFSEFAQNYGKDERFKGIDKMCEKEDIFIDFVRNFRKKNRDFFSSSQKAEKKFVELLKEQNHLNKNSKWSETKKIISKDERFKNIGDETLHEKIFTKFIQNKAAEDIVKEKEKQQRIQESIKVREEEVKRTLFLQQKELDKERQFHKREESISCFKALLSDLIHTIDVTWHNAKKILKKDHRWDSVRYLEKRDRDRIFDDHIELLNRKRKMLFHEILHEIPQIALNSSWSEVKSMVMSASRCDKFSKSEKKCGKEFSIYMENKLNEARKNFKQLLAETKIITYKSKTLLLQSDHLGDIEKALQKDSRYLVLEFMQDERRNMLYSYIDELHDQGPPPPPTASDPQKR